MKSKLEDIKAKPYSGLYGETRNFLTNLAQNSFKLAEENVDKEKCFHRTQREFYKIFELIKKIDAKEKPKIKGDLDKKLEDIGKKMGECKRADAKELYKYLNEHKTQLDIDLYKALIKFLNNLLEHQDGCQQGIPTAESSGPKTIL
jgi:hypothetical protein